MLREEEAVVVDVKPFNLHAMNYQYVTITFPDRSTDHARSVPKTSRRASNPARSCCP
jgi:hypothetical protein